MMIYTVTLNPSIDYSLSVKGFFSGEINRSEEEASCFGGKGINVSVMLANLGIDSVALGFAGGYTGNEIKRLASRAGAECDFVHIIDDSRINVKILSDSETAINGKGPFIRLEEEKRLLLKLSSLSEEDIVVVSGSEPESESTRLLENVLEATAHTRLVADMEGKNLLSAIGKKPYIIKPNESELAGIFGKREMTETEIAGAAKKLREEGVGNVLVSRGEKGALLACEDGNIYKVKAPRITPVSTVGAGDSFLAGFLAGLDRGYELALSLAAAAGSATAKTIDIASGEEVISLFAKM